MTQITQPLTSLLADIRRWCAVRNDSAIGIMIDTVFVDPIREILEDTCNADSLSFITMAFLCGDGKAEAVLHLSDALFLINYVFQSGPTPDPLESENANCDDAVDLTDAVYLVNYVFKGGPEPCCP